MKRLFLYSFIFLLVLMIPASAVYLQVENGTTEQFRNDTAVSNIGNPYVNATRINFTEDVYGWVNFSVNNRYSDGASDCFRIMKNGVMIGSEYCDTGWDWHFINQSIYGKYNSTDVIWYQRVDNIGSTGSIKGAVMSYTKTSVVILSLANNSAQTSRALNITWTSNLSTVRVQASTQSDFGTLLWNATSSTGFYNATVSTGLIYVRARGEDAGNNSETNWSTTNQYNIVDYFYYFNNNFSSFFLNNMTVDKGNNSILRTANFSDSWDNNHTDGWTLRNITGLYDTASFNYNSNLIFNVTTGWKVYYINLSDFNQSNYDIIYNFTVYSGISNAIGIDFGVTPYSTYDANLDFAQYNWISGVLSFSTRTNGVTGSTKNQTTLSQYIQNNNTLMHIRLQVNGSYARVKLWNASEAEGEWQLEITNVTNQYGSVGIHNLRTNMTIDDFIVRGLDSDRNIYRRGQFSTGNYSDFPSFSDKLFTATYNDVVYNYNDLSWNITGWANGTGTIIGKLNYLQAGIINQSTISGYVFNSTGSPINNSLVFYKYGNTSTNVSGYYQFNVVPTGNYSLVAGLSGYDAKDNFSYVDGSNDYILNFTLNVSTSFVSTKFSNVSELGLIYTEQFINSSGHLVDTHFREYTDTADTMYVYAGMMNYNENVNRSVYRLWNIMRVSDHALEDVMLNGDMFVDPNGYGEIQINASTGGTLDQQPHFYLAYLMKGYWEYKDFISNNSNQRYKEFLTNLNSTWMDTYFYNYATNSTHIDGNQGLLNRAPVICMRDMVLNETSNCLNNTYVQNIVAMFVNQTDPVTGYVSWIEYDTDISRYVGSTNYAGTFAIAGGLLYDNGYPNQTLKDTLNKTTNLTKNIQLQNGIPAFIGRGSYYLSGIMQFSSSNLVLQGIGVNVSPGVSYRNADKILQILDNQKYGNWDNSSYIGSYYVPFNHYDELLRYGLAYYQGYQYWLDQQLFVSYFSSIGHKYYDSSVVETPLTYVSLDLVNSSSELYEPLGLILFNSGKYSVQILARSNYHNKTYVQNGSNAASRPREYALYKGLPIWEDAKYPSIDFSPDPNNGTSEIFGGLNVGFDNHSDHIYGINQGLTDFTYSISNDSVYVNWTNVPTYAGKNLNYYNLSIVRIDDILNYTIKMGFNTSNYTPLSIQIGTNVIETDNNTVANIDFDSPNWNYSRGTETMNITNVTVSGGSVPTIEYALDVYGGFGTFGKQKRLDWNGSVSNSEYTISYDLEGDTTNFYGYLLNQPPGEMSHSPETPFTTGITTQTFDITFSQNLINLSWDINGTIKEWDNGTSTGSYTNSTAGTGIYNVTATGCNAQGCASFSWIWAVDGTAPASVTNVVVVSNTTHFNMSWVNPVDADFSYTYWLNGSTWAGNLTNTSWNISGGSHEVKNYSAQTVDAVGNMNSTKVWFNGTIQNQPITLSGVSGSYSIASGATLAIDAGYSDPDGDTGTFQDNSTLWNIDTSTGVVSWVGVEGDYDWQIGVSDGYGSIAYQNFTVSVSTQILYPNPVTGCSAVLGYYYANVSCSAVQP